eukprot:gene20705-21392_t
MRRGEVMGKTSHAAAMFFTTQRRGNSMAIEPRDTVVKAMTELFVNKDTSAIDRYWGPNYTQHSPSVADGVEGLRALATSLVNMPGFTITTHRVIADGDLVAVHYSGAAGSSQMVVFDIFRVSNGRIVEHGDAMEPVTPPNPSGHTQFDGPTNILDLGKTAANRALVKDFVTIVLIGGQYDKFPNFIDGENYTQHASSIADGLSGLAAAIEAFGKQGLKMEYFKLHQIIAEGNFVLTQAEGALGGKPIAFYDLFRVEGGRIVEHWDILQPIPPVAESKNKNGMF